MKLCVPKNQLKTGYSPKLCTQANKENVPQQIEPNNKYLDLPRQKLVVRKALGTKYSLSLHDQNQTLPILREKIELSSLLDNQGAENHPVAHRLLQKIESQQDMLHDGIESTRPQSVHKQIILEKLSKSQNKTKPKEAPNKPNYDNFITGKRTTLSPASSVSSSDSYNIWGDNNQPDLSLFDYYQFRSDRYENTPEIKLSASQVIKNIKQLLGSNIAIQSLCSQPWYTYGQQNYSSRENLIPKPGQPINRKTIMLQNYEKQGFARRRARVGEYNDEHLVKQQTLYRYEEGIKARSIRFDVKSRPKCRYIQRREPEQYSMQLLEHLGAQKSTQQVYQNEKKKQSNPIFGQKFLGSPELLLKKQMFDRLVQQQKMNQ